MNDKAILPGVKDEEHSYLMQRHGTWYIVRACCRVCATRKLNEWGVTNTDPDPDWLRRLPR